MASERRDLDAIDLLILRILQSDGRITNAELADRIELSPPSALQRVRNLEKYGYLLGYRAIVNPERLGLGLQVLAMISLALHQDRPIERFRRAVQTIPEVVECLHVSGECDFILRIFVRDMRAYEELIRTKLSTINGISQIKSSFVLATPKEFSEIPIE